VVPGRGAGPASWACRRLLSDAASYVNGAVIPVGGSAAAVDVGTVPFDPRVQVRFQDGS
jgi:meso-butanediol dehydrogenase / (S,S)-butanediol dehydrogenase / diacetyl reductase